MGQGCCCSGWRRGGRATRRRHPLHKHTKARQQQGPSVPAAGRKWSGQLDILACTSGRILAGISIFWSFAYHPSQHASITYEISRGPDTTSQHHAATCDCIPLLGGPYRPWESTQHSPHPWCAPAAPSHPLAAFQRSPCLGWYHSSTNDGLLLSNEEDWPLAGKSSRDSTVSVL